MSAPFPLPNVVLGQVRAGHPREILRIATEAIERAEGVQASELALHLMAAEKKGGSSIGGGVAVVSACVPVAVAGRQLCAFARLARPVPFRGVENNPCDIVFVMTSPESATQKHLRDLSVVIRTLNDRDFVDRLRAEKTPERILSLFQARDAAIRAAA